MDRFNPLIFAACFCALLIVGCSDDDKPNVADSNESDAGADAADEEPEYWGVQPGEEDDDAPGADAGNPDAGTTCSEHDDCEQSVCDPVSNECVDCLESTHCTSDEPFCIDRECKECETRYDCDDGSECIDNTCTEDCDGICEAPTGLDVPFYPVGQAGNVPLHWPFDGECIELTYAPSMTEYRETFEDAVAAWGSLSCNELCIGVRATETDDEPDFSDDDIERKEIHLATGEDLPEPVWGLPWGDAETGKLHGAYVRVTEDAPELSDDELDYLFVQSLGQILGLSMVDSPVESVMGPDPDVTEPTEADRASHCTMYGANRHCGCR